MGVRVCALSETIWFPTLIGQKQGSLDNLYRLDVAFFNVFIFLRVLEVGIKREKAYLCPTQASLHSTPLEYKSGHRLSYRYVAPLEQGDRFFRPPLLTLCTYRLYGGLDAVPHARGVICLKTSAKTRSYFSLM